MSTKLYVGNLAFHTTEDTLKNAFSEFGEVAEVKLILDRETGRSRGFAFVEMATPDDARKAMEAMNGADLEGRPLRVNEAEERRPREGGGGRGGPRGGGGGGYGGGGGGGYGGGGGGGGRGGPRGGGRGGGGGRRGGGGGGGGGDW
ncbi:MAG TPA: RNA-binding protein [Polyangiaceae bacterium]|nr:RNA-binding protein [Polyangiaceae bacterium]